MNDMSEKTKVTITHKIDLTGGGYIGGGLINNPDFPKNTVGYRFVDNKGEVTYWMDLTPIQALAIISVLSGALTVLTDINNKLGQE